MLGPMRNPPSQQFQGESSHVGAVVLSIDGDGDGALHIGAADRDGQEPSADAGRFREKEAARQQEQAQQPPAAEPPPVHWFYISEKGKVGPMSFADLATHARDGLLKPGDRVWSSKSPKWSQAQNVEGLNFGPVSNLNSNS